MADKKPKATVYIKFTMNGMTFEAKGTKEEVGKKLDKFIADQLAPLKSALKKAGL